MDKTESEILFSNADTVLLGKDILERTFDYSLSAPSKLEGLFHADLVQYNEDGIVDVVAEIKGPTPILRTQLKLIVEETRELIYNYSPRHFIFMAFHVLDPAVKREVLKYLDNEEREIHFYDAPWIYSRLQDFPEIAKKYNINLNKSENISKVEKEHQKKQDKSSNIEKDNNKKQSTAIASSHLLGNVTIQIKSDDNINKYTTLILPYDNNGNMVLDDSYSNEAFINAVITRLEADQIFTNTKQLNDFGYLWVDRYYGSPKPQLGIILCKVNDRPTDYQVNYKNAIESRVKELREAKILVPLFGEDMGQSYYLNLLNILMAIISQLDALNKLSEKVLFNIHIPLNINKTEKRSLVNKFINIMKSESPLNRIRDELNSITASQTYDEKPEPPEIATIKNKIFEAKDRNFWWIYANQKQWNILDLSIGEVQKYSTHNEKGVKRRIFENFYEVKSGDIVIGYQTPARKIIALFEIVSPAVNISGDMVSFKLIYIFNNKTSRSSLTEIDTLKNNPIFKRGNVGSLFKLTFNEFVYIVNTTELGPVERPPEEPKKEDVPTHRDSPAIVDKLNRKPLADSLCDEIRELWSVDDSDTLESDKLYAVHIQGPWGAGKSTFLNLIENNLSKEVPEGEKPWMIIKYNAWKNQHIDPPWWTLVETIYNQAKEKVKKKARFKRGEWRRRLQTGNQYYFWWAAGVFVLFIGIYFLIPFLFPSGDTQKTIEIVTGGDVQNAIKRTVISQDPKDNLIIKFSKAFTFISGIILSFITVFTSLKSTLISGALSSVKSFKFLSKDPQEKIKKHYADLIKATNSNVAVFVDDLDRCQPKYTVDFLEGLLTLFKEPQVLFVIAADKKWIAKCFEIQYEKFAVNYDKRGTTLGYHFIQKAFQLSVKLPQIKSPAIKKYWQFILKAGEDMPAIIEEKKVEAAQKFENLETQDEVYEEIEKNKDEDEQIDPVILSAAVEKLAEQEISEKEEKHILTDFADYLEPNARAIKRMANYYNLFRNSLVLEGKTIERTYLIRWLVLSQRWPLLAEALEKDPTLVDKPLKDIKDESLKLLFADNQIKNVIDGKKEEGKPMTKEIIEKLVGI